MFAFNLSHNETLQCAVDILLNTIFNRKTTFKFQKLNLFIFDVQSRKRLIARHLKQKNTYFSTDPLLRRAPSCPSHTPWYRTLVVQRQHCTVPWKTLHGQKTKAVKKNWGPHHSSHDLMCLLGQDTLTFTWLDKYTSWGSPTNRLFLLGFIDATKDWFWLSEQIVNRLHYQENTDL